MSNTVNQPSESGSDNSRPQRRWAHVVVAFFSALFIPAFLAYGVLVLWSSSYYVVVKPQAIGTIVVGTIIAAAAVYRHKRITLWGSALVGILVVLLLAVAPSIWAALLGRGAA